MILKIYCAVIFLTYFCHYVNTASILALFSSLSFSDHLVFRGYVSLLTQRGHSVVVMTPYPGHFQSPDVERIVELDVGQESSPFWEDFKKLMTNTKDYYQRLKEINELNVKIAIAQLKSKQMTALFINPHIKFDLVITEADIPILYAVAEKYKVPHISITISSGKIHQHESKGNPIHPLLYPDVNTFNYRNLTIWQKILELNRHFQTRREYYNNYLLLCQAAAEKILGLKRNLLEVEYDIDVLFIAANPVLTGNRPSVPAVVYTDRMHIKPGSALPQNLKTTLDSATKGAVYFSLGAIQESEELPARTLQILADAFRELPYKVLWKIGNVTRIKNMPVNVVTQVWFPQQEVLAHPNVKAFVTHGGPRSLEEAIFYEVPIVGIPTIQSRKVFIEEITKFGAGEVINPYNLNKEIVQNTISIVAGDNGYKKAISLVKQMTQDPIISGPEDAVWWAEYVIRNGGAKFLRSPAVGVPFYKYYMLDIMTYLLVGIFICLWILITVLRSLVRCLRKRRIARKDAGGKFKAL